jgi:hypothetical protein
MRECYSCRENDRSWSTSLSYRCTTKSCENYVDIPYDVCYVIKKENNEYDECFMKYF